MIIRQLNYEINLKNMELGTFMHKHSILDLGPLSYLFQLFYCNLMVNDSKYGAEMFLYMKKRLTQFCPKMD